MMLTQQALHKACRFVETQGRPLEAARLHFHLFGAPAEAVLSELARFQNPDGSFGHALEPDCRIAAGSALCTSVALQILRELGLAGPSPLAVEALAYLLRTCDRESLSWRMVPEAAADTPQAPWWNQAGQEKGCAFALNPTAELLGYLYDYRESAPPDLIAALSEKIVKHLAGLNRIIMHDFLCCKRLAEAAGLEESLRAALLRELLRLLPGVVACDPAQWAQYSLRPLQVAEGPASPFYEPLRAAIARNLDYEIAAQQEDGSWPLTWSWAEQYPDTWPQAAREWAGVVTVERLLTLKRYGRIAE